MDNGTAMQGENSSPRLSAGAAILPRLHELGVEQVFVNSGTDFPPIIEGLAETSARGIPVPRLVTVPHEHAALGMAHGHHLISGKPQVVMLHTNVGLANGIAGAINAACENVPVLIMSGRTPVTEAGRFGSRTVPIGWGQEMRDQAALVRESCKWDYELRFPEQIPHLLDRALAIACSTPRGPVYLALPREVLCENIELPAGSRPLIRPSVAAASQDDLDMLAAWIAAAKAPLVIAQRGAGDAVSFRLLAELADAWGIAVCSWWATALAVSTEHPCHVGADPERWLRAADLVIVLNSLAPWWPDIHRPAPDAKIVHIGPDPIFSRFPVRNFRSDLSVGGELAQVIPALGAALRQHPPHQPAVNDRRARIFAASASGRAEQEEQASSRNRAGISREWVSLSLGRVLEGVDSTVFSELGVRLGLLSRRTRNSWFQEPHSGGLGWSFPAAMGARLADPDRVCVATMGDGSYMFANPVACHQIAEAAGVPILVVVLNNGEWGAVRQSVSGLYPDGRSARSNAMALTSLNPSPDFVMIAKASRAWAKRVESADQLEAVLGEALRAVTEEGRLALVEVRTLPD